MSLKKVSIIMPTFNRGYIIEMAINSILNQDYKNIELIVVDDGSTDNTSDIIKKYTDKRLKYIKLDKNSGGNFARNVGLNAASGEYISFQDSDDFSYCDRIKSEVKYLEDTNSDMVFTSFRRINKNKKTIVPSSYIESDNIHSKLLSGNMITTQVLLGKKEIFEDIKFDEMLPRFQDWDLVIRISAKYKVSHLNVVLLDMYVSNDSISKNTNKGIVALKRIYKKYYHEFNNKQKCRILFRIGIFEMLSDIDATTSFKDGLKYYKNLEYILIYILYKIKIFKFLYLLLK